MIDSALGEVQQVGNGVDRVRILAVRAAEQTKAARGIELDQLVAQLAGSVDFRRQAFDTDVLIENEVNEQRRIAGTRSRRPGLVRNALRARVGGQQRERYERDEDGADDRGGMLAQ